jgi:hypothetical protein
MFPCNVIMHLDAATPHLQEQELKLPPGYQTVYPWLSTEPTGHKDTAERRTHTQVCFQSPEIMGLLVVDWLLEIPEITHLKSLRIVSAAVRATCPSCLVVCICTSFFLWCKPSLHLITLYSLLHTFLSLATTNVVVFCIETLLALNHMRNNACAPLL